MQKVTQKTPFVFYAGMVLLCLVLFSAHLTSGLYARYTSTSSAGDNARVAKFDITHNITDSQPADIDLHFFKSEDLSDNFIFEVQSNSEVSVKYDVIVTLPEGKTYDWLSITLYSEGLGSKDPDSVAGNVFTFSDVHSFAPATGGSTSMKYTLTFAIRDTYVGNPQGVSNIEDGTVIVTVHAEQQD